MSSWSTYPNYINLDIGIATENDHKINKPNKLICYTQKAYKFHFSLDLHYHYHNQTIYPTMYTTIYHYLSNYVYPQNHVIFAKIIKPSILNHALIFIIHLLSPIHLLYRPFPS